MIYLCALPSSYEFFLSSRTNHSFYIKKNGKVSLKVYIFIFFYFNNIDAIDFVYFLWIISLTMLSTKILEY